MHILKKILLGSALLPVLFVASLVFSSVTNTTPTAEAAACRVGLTLDGTVVADSSESDKNVTRDLAFTASELDAGLDLIIRWYTDVNIFQSKIAHLRIPDHAFTYNQALENDINTKEWGYDGGDKQYIFFTQDGGWLESSAKIGDLRFGDRIQLYARANGDTCRAVVNIEEQEEQEIRVGVNGPDRLDEGEEGYFYAKFEGVNGTAVPYSNREYRWIVKEDNGSGATVRDTGWNGYYDNNGPNIRQEFSSSDEYRVFVFGRLRAFNTTVAQDSAAMDVTVEPVVDDAQEATLQVRSQNPSSGVGMDFAGNSGFNPGDRFETYQEFTRTGDINNARIWAEPDPDDQEFGYWQGCGSGTSGRECVVSVNEGDTKTITAVYNDPPDDAVVYVRSSNPSSGVDINDVGGNVHGGDTSYKIERTGTDIDGELRAEDPAPNGNDFIEWQGCDDENNGGRDCEVQVNEGSSQTVTAVYETDPGSATVNVYSSNPSSGVSVSRAGGNVESGSTVYSFTKSGDIDGELRAPSSEDGNDFLEWQGCDDENNGGRDCEVRVSEGGSQSVTAVYESDGGETYGCMDPNANNYDPNATESDGSCTYDPNEPDPEAVLNVYSQNPSSASMDVLNSNDISDFWTSKTFRQNDAITADIWARNTHSGSSGGNPFSHWENCPEEGDHRKHCPVDVSPGSTLTITAVYDDAPVEGCTDPDAENYDSNADVDDGSCVYQAVIDNFNLSDPNLDFNPDPPQLHVDDQPFSLVWSTTNANSVEGDWGDTYSRLSNSFRLPTSWAGALNSPVEKSNRQAKC
jgi:hypothetical protein